MEKEETLKNYIDVIQTRFEKMQDLQTETKELESELLRAEDNIKNAKECSKKIERFNEKIRQTQSGYGWDVMVCIRRGSPSNDDEWEELYRYHMPNIDDLINLVEDRLYKELEDAICYVRKSRQELAKTTD